jgi:iron complex outermembrane recepter protein
MLNNTLLAKSVRFALVGGAAAAAMSAPAVFAAEEGAKVERIEVTGSRIKQTDLEGANPVTVIDRDDMIKMGITDVGDLLQRLPAMSGSPIGTTTNNGGTGAVTVNLRGMGAIRTLVLVNGRRTVDGGDFQTIPSSMIKRVEILKDGASAVYGADAVAGVVNILTRNDFEGVELTAQTSDSFETDSGVENTISFVGGKTFDSGNVVVGFDYTDQESILQSDTPWFTMQNTYYITEANADNCAFCEGNYFDDVGFMPGVNVMGFGSSRVPNGNFKFNKDSAIAPTGTLTKIDGAAGTSIADFKKYNGNWWDPANDSYNYAPVNYLQTPYKKWNAFVESGFDLSESIHYASELRVNYRQSEQKLAPMPFDTQTDPGYAVALRNADGTPVLDEFGNQAYANGVSKDNLYNPFGEDIIRMSRRVVEDNRTYEQDVLQFQFVNGLSGEINDNWTWDASYNMGYRSRTDTDKGQWFGPNVAKALGPSFINSKGVATCGTAAAPIAGCVPMDMFGGPGAITDEMLDYVGADLVDTTRTRQDIFTAAIAGDLFELPGGMVGSAVGYEYRREELVDTPDSGKQKGEVTGSKGAGVSGNYFANSIFGEISLPILSEVAGAELLELKLGGRYDNFSSFGGNTTFQAGLKWMPLNGLLVRGTYGEVYRAPTVNELFAGQADSFPTAQDPCNTTKFGGLSAEGQALCLAQGVPAGGSTQADSQLPSRVGGNPELQPEEGDTVTVGISYSPEFLDGFNVTVDYWDIQLDNVIDSLSATNVLDLCYNELNANECNQITRKPDGTINAIFAANRNLAARTATGVDTEMSYNFSTDIGDFKAFVGWTHLIERADTDYVGAAPRDMVGTFDFSLGETFAEDKVNFNFDYYWNDLSVSYAAEYIGEITSATAFWEDGYLQKVDAQLYHDIAVAYSFDTGTRVSFNLTNLTNEEPAYIDNGFNASTDPSTYRMFGRSYSVRLTQKF